jgi:tRNA pseudouridine synthase 10
MTPEGPLLPEIDALASFVYERCQAAAAGHEFTTYLLGVQARRLARRVPEDALEAWKSALKRAVGLRLALAWEPLGRRVSFDGAELVLRWDQDQGAIDDVRTRSVFFFGRYAKLVRDLPQTRATWPCPTCRRAGCDACAGTGRKFPTSIEDLVAGPLAVALGVDPSAGRLHGMGREDTDVRCLGPGRPFVVEVQRPVRRTTDLTAVAAAIEAGAGGRIALTRPLEPCGERVVARVKAWDAAKVYRAVALAEGPLDPARVAALPGLLRGATLAQRTPHRVSRSRSDLVRARRVVDVAVLAHEGAKVELEVESESGTYIKELISGDDGRTSPSVAELLGLPARCVELDVLEVRAVDAELLGQGAVPLRAAEEGAQSTKAGDID